MGTNIYGRRIPTQEQLQTISSHVLEGNLEIVKTLIEPFDTIHIGKRSAGWRFLFNHQGLEFTSFQEYKDWMKDFKLETEYGASLTQDEFWEDVEDRQQKMDSCLGKTSQQSWYKILDGYEFSTSTEFC
jgi:hypothetical protein